MADEARVRVLVIGPRPGLLEELRRLRAPYVVWSAQQRRYAGAEAVSVAPVVLGAQGARRGAEGLRHLGPFTHVIAGSEAAVVTASRARRVLGARASATSVVIRCHDKLRMKAHLERYGIPMAPYVDPNAGLPPAEILQRLGAPVVVKPRRSSGSRDVHFVPDATELARMSLRGHLVERMVRAPEVSVESFVHEGEILFENVTEYARKAHVNLVPASLPRATREALLKLNREALRAMRIRWGMTHLEAYLTESGVLFGEVALRPPGGYIMDLLQQAWGFDPWRAFVAVELGREFTFPRDCSAHAAALVLHPGEGTLVAVHGLEQVRRHPAVVRARVRIRPGQRIEARAGVGADVGHVILRAGSREELLAAWAEVESVLRLELAHKGEQAGAPED